MPLIAAIGPAIGAIGGALGGASGISGLISAGTGIAGALSGGSTAAKTQGQVNSLYQPYNQAGVGALNQLNQFLTPGFDATSAIEKTPGYQFQYDQGLDAGNRAAAAAGTLNSGGTLKAQTRYGQNYASNAYQTALNNLYRVAGLGEASLGPLADNYASGNASQNAALNQGIGAGGNLLTNLLSGGSPAPGTVQTTPYPNMGGPIIPANNNNPLSLSTTLPNLSFGGI